MQYKLQNLIGKNHFSILLIYHLLCANYILYFKHV